MTIFGTHHLGLFVTAGLLLNVTPGPDTLFILARTLSQGRSAGVASALGISTGCIGHTLAAAFGFSAIISRSDAAFTCVKLAGAAYLIYLGVQMLCSRSAKANGETPAPKPESAWLIYRQAVLTNVLNPKVGLFFLAFLPQFVAAEAASQVTPYLFLGFIFIFNGTIYLLLLVAFASAVLSRLQRSSRISSVSKRITGAVFVGLGLRLALQRR